MPDSQHSDIHVLYGAYRVYDQGNEGSPLCKTLRKNKVIVIFHDLGTTKEAQFLSIFVHKG
jgi:hypothetical protein